MQVKKRTYSYISVLIITALFTLYEELFLRRYLFHHHIYIVADSLPNFLAALLFTLVVVIVKKRYTNREALRSGITAATGLICYEIAQIWMPDRVFDFKDIIASVLGGALAYGIIYVTNKLTA